ncbi:hypothetical protein VPUCM_1114 [Vibrio parahaemolyticus UCM-V493]|nr:hypothetical protein VPUCM_1114 [Vibrio parahaemolyticus UCM-V493]
MESGRCGKSFKYNSKNSPVSLSVYSPLLEGFNIAQACTKIN